jgi:hypothetical protein
VAQRRKTPPRATKARVTQRRPAKRRPKRDTTDVAPVPPTETAEQALVGIAQDAVVIVRRALAYRAAVAIEKPARIGMHDCVALLKLMVDLVPAAMKGHEGQRASFDALTPDEREQFATLLSKVEYA